MARHWKHELRRFSNHLEKLERTRQRAEDLYRNGLLRLQDVEETYKSLYLSAFTAFEGALEDLFLGMLCNQITYASAVLPKVSFRTLPDARSVVFGGRAYVDWLPYHWTEKRAKAFFRAGRPFTILEKADKKSTDTLLSIRNAIAHKSAHALNEFQTDVVGGLAVLPRERKPAGYLRGTNTLIPPQNRYQALIEEMERLATAIFRNRH